MRKLLKTAIKIYQFFIGKIIYYKFELFNFIKMARNNKWRKGDKSEYLAQLFLSTLSFSNPIYRQEDYGIDFVCSIIDKEGDNLYPNEAFNVQVKSGTNRKVEYKGTNNPKEFNWLLKNQTPIIFTHLDLDKQEMYFYSYLQLNYFNVNRKIFNKDDKISLRYDVKSTKDGQNCTLDLKCYDIANVYHYNLGNPFMTLSIKDITQDHVLEKKKLILKKILKIERENILYKNLRLPLTRWLYQYETDNIDSFRFGWAHFCTDDSEKTINKPDEILTHMGQLLITLAGSYKLNSNDETNGDAYSKHYNSLKEIIVNLPIENLELDGELYNYKSYLTTLGYINQD